MSGTLNTDENHPAVGIAWDYLRSVLADPFRVAMLQESFASSALGGNRTAEVCGETLHLVLTGQGVGERYLLGLAWTVRDLESAFQ